MGMLEMRTPVRLMDGKNLLYSAKCEKWEKDGSHTTISPSLNWAEKSPRSIVPHERTMFGLPIPIMVILLIVPPDLLRVQHSVHEILDLCLSRFGFNLPIVVIGNRCARPHCDASGRQSGWHHDDFHTMWVRRIEKAAEGARWRSKLD